VTHDGLRPIGKILRSAVVVRAIADLIAQVLLRLPEMPLGLPDRDQVQPGDLLIRSGLLGDLRGSSGCLEVAGGQRVRGDEVRHVDDRANQVVVDARTFGQPLVAVGPQLVEEGTTDQAQGCRQVGDALGAAGFATDPEPAEQVFIDQDVLQLVDADARA
jgi:hypothetical protein